MSRTVGRRFGLAQEPSSRTGVKLGFFSLIEGLGAKFGASLSCGAGADQEQWAWRPRDGEFSLLGHFGDS